MGYTGPVAHMPNVDDTPIGSAYEMSNREHRAKMSIVRQYGLRIAFALRPEDYFFVESSTKDTVIETLEYLTKKTGADIVKEEHIISVECNKYQTLSEAIEENLYTSSIHKALEKTQSHSWFIECEGSDSISKGVFSKALRASRSIRSMNNKTYATAYLDKKGCPVIPGLTVTAVDIDTPQAIDALYYSFDWGDEGGAIINSHSAAGEGQHRFKSVEDFHEIFKEPSVAYSLKHDFGVRVVRWIPKEQITSESGAVMHILPGAKVLLSVSEQLVHKMPHGGNGYRGSIWDFTSQKEYIRPQMVEDLLCVADWACKEQAYGFMGVDWINTVRGSYVAEINPRWTGQIHVVEQVRKLEIDAASRVYGYAHCHVPMGTDVQTYVEHLARQGIEYQSFDQVGVLPINIATATEGTTVMVLIVAKDREEFIWMMNSCDMN